MHTRTRWLWLWVRKEESQWKWQLWWICTVEQLFFLFDFFVSHLFLFLMGLVCNWLCVHHFRSIMPKGKISTFVVLSMVFATIFSIGEYNWIDASPLQCWCVIKWKVEYLDPFEKKWHVILFFFTTLTLLKFENGVNDFFFPSCMKLLKFAIWFSDFVLSLP